ncbi:hypothetical protein [Hymenobacter metallicola]|uniref:SH3 domain-containing protein n=1 Tax=Hymenobacter metallicola TaxID=2563114 RepID=A0A4Z0QGS1_9BACT|nr:hypothetical protein [Hymenobacter metallicola]TGE29220.1 hypothetical protein E5K02_07140 [Hymenobacter metallicola]
MREPCHSTPTACQRSVGSRTSCPASVFQPRRRAWLLVALAWTGLLSCSEDKSRPANSELRVEQPAVSSTAGGAPESSEAAEETAGLTAGAGTRYRVLAETAYFYDSPRQGKPGGQYLRRGDVLYGAEDENGFIKTQFVNPNGATVTGWLKAEEVGRLAGTTSPARSTRPAVRPAAPPPAPIVEDYETEAPRPPETDALPAPRSGQTAVVRVARSYFYNSPDLVRPRKAHCVQGDKVRLGEEEGEAVYVVFTNWENVTTTGWMRKEALRYNR